jgi:transcriptional regulator with XRE-family HTH domain
VAANVRSMRNTRRLNLSQLAAASGVSKAALSKLESASTNPTLETLTMLASALSVTVAELVTPATSAAIHVVRREEGMSLSDNAAQARLIHARDSAHSTFELHQMVLGPGRTETSATHGDGSWEHVFVTSGSLWVGPVNDPVLLHEGDYAAFPSHVPHAYRSEAETVTTVLLFLVSPRIGVSEG